MRKEQQIHSILSYLYQLRTLTAKQIYQMVFQKENTSMEWCQRQLNNLVKQGYLEKVGYYVDESYYFLKKKATDYLKENGLIELNQTLSYPQILPPYQIKIDKARVNHQLALNSFVAEVMELGVSFSYSDEKFNGSYFSVIRPDGLLIMNDTYYFLEMDMGTENAGRLRQKWDSYAKFARSKEYYTLGKKVVVLFILKQQRMKQRVELLRELMTKYLSAIISPNFNLYIDNQDPLIERINPNKDDELVSLFTKKNFLITPGIFPNREMGDIQFHYYIYRLNEKHILAKENDFFMEFLVDDYTCNNIYVYQKIKSLSKLLLQYENIRKRKFHYLVIVDSIMQAKHICMQIGYIPDNLYFTTKQRLREYTFYSAIFQIHGNMLYHFAQDNINIKILEQIVDKIG